MKMLICSICENHFEIEDNVYSDLIKFNATIICDDCIDKSDEEDKERESKEAQERFVNKMKNSGYLPRHLDQTFDNFDVPNARARIVGAVKKYDPASGKWLFLLGKTGTGKDHIASAIGREYVLNSYKSIYAGTMQAIMRRYRDMAFGEVRSETEAFKDIAEVGLLIIRDIGVKSLTDAERGVIVDILDHRYNCNLPVIVTGNVRPEMLKDVFDERVIDRMKEVSYTINDKFTVAFDWDSYREGKV